MQNDFIKDLISKRLDKEIGEKCPEELHCGDDDAWYDATTERICLLKKMYKFALGDVDEFDSDELMRLRATIMQLLEEEIIRAQYNTTEYLTGIIDDKIDKEIQEDMNK